MNYLPLPSSMNNKPETAIDLRHNYPLLDEQAEVLNRYVQDLGNDLQKLLSLPPWSGKAGDRNIAATWLGTASSDQTVVICASGNHALTVLLLALKLPGKTVATEDFTYSGFKALAKLLNVQLVACATDEHGLIPEALDALCKTQNISAVFVQPTIHNPTCITMPLRRRQQIANVVNRHQTLLIEDDAYRFLHDAPPSRFCDLAPTKTFYVSSLAKSFSPMLKVTYLVVPKQFQQEVENAIRLTSSGASGFLVHVASAMIIDGKIDTIVQKKQQDARRRQVFVQDILHGTRWNSHPNSYHVWLHLPHMLSADALQEELSHSGVQVSSGTEFASTAIDGDRSIRFSIGAERDDDRLKAGLHAIRRAISRHVAGRIPAKDAKEHRRHIGS